MEVSDVRDRWDIPALSVLDFRNRRMTIEEFNHLGRICGAYWSHSGDPQAPHAVTTKKQCTDGYINVPNILVWANLCEILAAQLVYLWEGECDPESDHPIDWVVGSNHSAVTLASAFAQKISARFDFPLKGPDNTQVWERHRIGPTENVLDVEELMTTGSTSEKVRAAIRSAHEYPIRFVRRTLVLVHRSELYEVDGEPVSFLFHYDIRVWDPADCPLCAGGSKRISNVKSAENWALLNAEV